MRYTSYLDVPVPAADLFRWHARPGAFERLSPPWQPVSLKEHEGIRDGDRAVIRLGTTLVGVDWAAEHRGYSEGCLDGRGACQFEDVQVDGPFAAWHHTHRMLPAEAGSVAGGRRRPTSSRSAGCRRSSPARIRRAPDRADVRLPPPRDARGPPPPRRGRAGPMTVAITGASGLVGRQLTAFLQGGGHTVVRLVAPTGGRVSRGPQDEAVYWDVAAGEVDLDALRRGRARRRRPPRGRAGHGARRDHRRHAAASGRAGRRARSSCSRALAALTRPPRVLVSASASGYYGEPRRRRPPGVRVARRRLPLRSVQGVGGLDRRGRGGRASGPSTPGSGS